MKIVLAACVMLAGMVGLGHALDLFGAGKIAEAGAGIAIVAMLKDPIQHLILLLRQVVNYAFVLVAWLVVSRQLRHMAGIIQGFSQDGRITWREAVILLLLLPMFLAFGFSALIITYNTLDFSALLSFAYEQVDKP